MGLAKNQREKNRPKQESSAFEAVKNGICVVELIFKAAFFMLHALLCSFLLDQVDILQRILSHIPGIVFFKGGYVTVEHTFVVV